MTYDERISHWLTDVRRADLAERVLGIAGGLLVIAFVGVCTTMSIVLW
jgi:hypothetical protein